MTGKSTVKSLFEGLLYPGNEDYYTREMKKSKKGAGNQPKIKGFGWFAKKLYQNYNISRVFVCLLKS
ncbi:MAG: hypothetical protein B6D61_14680 [Bacteroidetes bacterium 4484_249]|nr:MAG: hypothetical protein B6D61_14680 [Bacteroidetes bacterium 4484_249]